MNHSRSGFTFIEVLACLLVVSLGIAAVVSLTLYAEIMSERAQAKSTAMSTALAVAIDPSPLLHVNASKQWTTSINKGSITSTGWINGYYVVRVESQALGSTPCAGFSSNPVSVDVYGGVRGTLVASYTTRIMEQAFTP
jgi:prepilin-type N-terminal cleavage/methylation domain-containing protein